MPPRKRHNPTKTSADEPGDAIAGSDDRFGLSGNHEFQVRAKTVV
ncbi:hypothetical protein [Defluviimonas sp. WL0050]|nr:hypothetical protein [Defluviimonas sp. WL0050]